MNSQTHMCPNRTRVGATNRKIILNRVLKIGWSIFRAALLIALGYILIYPLLYMVSIAFRDIMDMFDDTVKWIPKHLTLYNLKRVITAMEYPTTLMTTVIVSLGSSIFTIITCSLAGYGFARFKFKGSGFVFALLLFTIIVPQQFFILPTYLNFQKVHLLESVWSMLIPALFGAGIRSGLCVYIFRQFFKGMPRELEEAAYIDGCGYIKTYLRIMAPSAVSAFVTCFLFSFVWTWNDYQVSGMLMQGKMTLSTALVMLKDLLYNMDASVVGQTVNDTTRTNIDLQAGALLVVTPVLILYLFFQRFFVESIERTGLVE